MNLIYTYVVNFLLLKNKLLGNIASLILAIYLGIYAGNMPLDSMDDVAQSDIRSYFGNYSNPYSTNFEIGYRSLSHFFASIGVDYYTFRTVTSVVLMLMLWFVVSKITKYNAGLFFSFYAIFPFFVDTIQFRTMIASIFIVLSFWMLSKNRKYMTIIFLLIGSLFQTLTLVFILIIPLHMLHSEKAFQSFKSSIYFIIIPVVTIFFAYLFGLMTSIVKLIGTVTGRTDLIVTYSRLSLYQTGWNYVFIYLIIFILELILIYYIFTRTDLKIKYIGILRATAPFLLIGIYALPIIRFYTDINRFFRLSEIIFFILFTVYISAESSKKKIKMSHIYTYLLAYAIVLLSAYVYYRGSDFPHIINILQLNGYNS